VKGVADVKVKFFCKKCGRVVSALGSSYHKTERGIRFSAIRRHYWDKHPEVWRNPYKKEKSKVKTGKSMGRRGLPAHIVKKYGITKKAWRVYKAGKGGGKKKKGGGGKKVARRRRPKLFRTLGLKGVLMGGAMYALVAYLVRRFAPQAGAYTPALALAGAGIVKRSLLAPALAMATGELLTDLLLPGGIVTFPSVAPRIGAPRYDL
jgi:hypothetical protein